MIKMMLQNYCIASNGRPHRINNYCSNSLELLQEETSDWYRIAKEDNLEMVEMRREFLEANVVFFVLTFVLSGSTNRESVHIGPGDGGIHRAFDIRKYIVSARLSIPLFTSPFLHVMRTTPPPVSNADRATPPKPFSFRPTRPRLSPER